jgi:hypothetical protein
LLCWRNALITSRGNLWRITLRIAPAIITNEQLDLRQGGNSAGIGVAIPPIISNAIADQILNLRAKRSNQFLTKRC